MADKETDALGQHWGDLIKSTYFSVRRKIDKERMKVLLQGRNEELDCIGNKLGSEDRVKEWFSQVTEKEKRKLK